MRIVVTGASGFVGRRVVPSLVASGARVLVVGRDVPKLETLFGSSVEACSYADLATASRGADALLHLAVLNNDRSGTPDDFRRANVTLLEEVVDAARDAGIGLFIQTTTLKALDPARSDPYATTKREAERFLASREDLRCVTLRLAAVYADDAYKGTLGILEKVPAFLRPSLRGALMCARPAVHVDRVSDAVLGILNDPPAARHVERPVTDCQKGNRVYAAMARTIDLAIALGIIVFLWWLMLLIWAVVRFSSPGPGLFAQTRVGREGKPFTCYKFRTMYQGTRQAATHAIGTASVTRVGSFLRRSKLDELPQVFNIVLNDMSFVGPRPCLPSQHELVAERQRRGILSIKGGITGWAQIRDIDMSDPVRLAAVEAGYLAMRTTLLDLWIIIATFTGSGQGDRVTAEARIGEEPSGR